MITTFIFLILGFTFLIKGADLLVEGASSVAKRLQVSDLVIGLTVVAFGTSTPELFVNIAASIRGNTEIAVGNVLGSNIANIFLILGVSSIIYPLTVTKGTVWKEIPLALLASLLLGILANDQLIDRTNLSALTRIDGLVLLSFFIIFVYYSFSIAKKIEGINQYLPQKECGLIKSFLFVFIGVIGLCFGGKWIVDSAQDLALRLGLSQLMIGLTVVAIGTSLPELATSAVAAYKRNVEIAVGNVVGSNIFNIFFVLGISSIIKPLPFQVRNNIDISIVVLASLLLFFSMFTGQKHMLDRWEGVLFVIFYIGYVVFVVVYQESI